MAVERAGTESDIVDVLARVLDKCVALDPWDRLRLMLGNTRWVTSVEIQKAYGETTDWHAIALVPPIDPGISPDELGVREPRPNPKRPRAGAAAVNPHE